MIGEKIKRLRMEKGLSARKFAEKINVSPERLSKWERGKGGISAPYLKKIADFFKLTVEQLTSPSSSLKTTAEVDVFEGRLKAIMEECCKDILNRIDACETREKLMLKYLEELIEKVPKIERIRLFDGRLISQIEKPSKLTPTESKRFDMNLEALERWVESDEVFEVSQEMLMEFCLNYNIKERQRRIEDVTESLRFMLTEKIIGEPEL